MTLDLLISVVLFFGLAFGPGWPIAARLPLAPVERAVASFVLSLLIGWLAGWLVYAGNLPARTLLVLPTATALGLWIGRRELAALIAVRDVRSLFVGQLIVTAWSVGWLSLVVSYSGGDWTGDWFGQWERTRFFLERWPRDVLFFGIDPMPSRPPLVNLTVSTWLALTHGDFAHFQLFLTMWGSLVYAPAALLARRFSDGGIAATGVLAVLLMLHPLFLQNVTYSWTKLPTAFFIFAALYFFLRAHDPDALRVHALLFSVSLAVAILAHYSAGPYAVVLAVAWCALGWTRRADPARWRLTRAAALAGGLVLATWFGWAFATYSAHGTLATNTSVVDQAATASEQLQRIALNLRDTLVPPFLRRVDFNVFGQRSVWGAWRDWFFLLYQRNLFFAVGSVGAIIASIALMQRARGATPRSRRFWLWFIGATVVLGVGVHGSRDIWGNTGVCLQPLVLLGVVLLAAHWEQLGRGGRLALIIGTTADAVGGVLLQFGAQSYLIDRWFTPGRTEGDVFTSYSEFALMNLRAKHQLALRFFGETLPISPALVLAFLGALLALALIRARRNLHAPATP